MSEAQEQGEQIYYPRSTFDTYGSSINNLTNPNELLDHIRYNLQNFRIDELGNPVKIGEPLVNDLGLNHIMGTAQAIISQNSVLSNLENRKEVSNLMTKLTSDLCVSLMVHRKAFGIKNREECSNIMRIVLFPTFMTLMRSYKQGERGFWKGSVSEIIHAEKRDKKGIFKNVFG